MRRMLWPVMCLCVLVASGAVAEDFKAMGDRVNIRAKPSLQGEVVGQASNGEVLAVVAQTNQWVGIVPPQRIGLWVFSPYVQNGVVNVPKLIVRSGPGLAYSDVGAVKKGDKLNVRKVQADWSEIDPPANCTLWVDAKHAVSLTPPTNAPEVEETAPAVVVPAVEPPVASVPGAMVMPEVTPPIAPAVVPALATNGPVAPKELVEKGLIPVEGQGQLVRAEGTIRTAGYLFSPPGKYRLVAQTKSALTTICYLNGDNKQFASLVGKEVTVLGRQYWLKGESSPVIAAEEVVPK